MEKQEIIIVGGGLAGFTAAIHLARKEIPVLVLEKDTYPRHKVCGEYVSKEILPYFGELELSLEQLNPVNIQRMLFSTNSGRSVETELPLGGLGISRFALDHFLFQKARESGVRIQQEKVNAIVFDQKDFRVTTSENTYVARHVLAAFGKRSLLDKTLSRDFTQRAAPWLAVKNHYVHSDFPDDLVALHNFQGGYCGLSKTETGEINLCYLASYRAFKAYRNHEDFQREVLCQNPYLRKFFQQAEPVMENISIAQVSFHPKESVKNQLLFLGDAAGLLHPLCGNGMAMAIHSAKLAAELLLSLFEHRRTKPDEVHMQYAVLWRKHFKRRMATGRLLQKILLNQKLAEASQQVIATWPGILPRIIKNTHGRPII